MRMLVFGGTVFLSRAVAERARDRGHDVTVANRGRSGPPVGLGPKGSPVGLGPKGSPPDGVRQVLVDRDQPEGLRPLADGAAFDAVVDVARQPGHVGDALGLLGPLAGHWTFVSSGSVYADNATPGQRVDRAPVLDPHPGDDASVATYGPRKVACEDAVRAALGERAFICRAGLIVGPGDEVDRYGYWPLRLARGGEILAPGSPDDAVQVVDVRDLAAWIVRAAEGGLAGTFDGIGPVHTLADFFARVAEGLDLRPDLTWVDQAFLREHGVDPWMGPRSLPLWLPVPEYAGFMRRDGSPSFDAGLVTRPLPATARDTLAWERAVAGRHQLAAGLTAEEEAELLRAWNAR